MSNLQQIESLGLQVGYGPDPNQQVSALWLQVAYVPVTPPGMQHFNGVGLQVAYDPRSFVRHDNRFTGGMQDMSGGFLEG